MQILTAKAFLLILQSTLIGETIRNLKQIIPTLNTITDQSVLLIFGVTFFELAKNIDWKKGVTATGKHVIVKKVNAILPFGITLVQKLSEQLALIILLDSQNELHIAAPILKNASQTALQPKLLPTAILNASILSSGDERSHCILQF